VRNRSQFSPLRWLSLALTIVSVVLFVLQLVRFSRLWANLPPGLTMGGIPVGSLDRQQASQRLLQVYSLPVELHYEDGVIQLSPSVVGLEIDMESMLAAAELERTRTPFWSAYWNYLWGREAESADIPLRITYSEQRLRDYLNTEVASRYDRPPTAAMPVVGTVSFQPGQEGTVLDVERSVLLIDAALRSTSNRVVSLPLKTSEPSRPDFRNLEVLLRQTIEVSGYDGTAGVYLYDLQTAQEVNVLLNGVTPISSPPDVAFTASSTIKIPILVSLFRRFADQPDAESARYMEEMIAESSNPSADWLMENRLDAFRGPLIVTEDIQQLKLDDTFLSGYFYSGAPLLQVFTTPANSRTDVSTDPDPYSQTTPSEIGMLLVDLYQCAENSGGSLLAIFPGEITQAKCTQMIELLTHDHLGSMIQGGVPDGTRVAHKHGWVIDNFGVIHDMSDAGIVYTPGGNYVLTVFLYHPTQLIYDEGAALVKNISTGVYNFYNLP
jgi:hypothetical protein